MPKCRLPLALFLDKSRGPALKTCQLEWFADRLPMFPIEPVSPQIKEGCVLSRKEINRSSVRCPSRLLGLLVLLGNGDPVLAGSSGGRDDH